MRGHAACRPALHHALHHASAIARCIASRTAPDRPRRSRAGCRVDAPARHPAGDSDFPRIATRMASRGVSRSIPASASPNTIGWRRRSRNATFRSAPVSLARFFFL
jgi:hypothetical protein